LTISQQAGDNAAAIVRTTPRCSLAFELVRSASAWCPFWNDESRVALALKRLVMSEAPSMLIGRIGAAGVLFPYRQDELSKPVFWHLFERPIRKWLGRLLRAGDVFIDVGAHRGWHATYGFGLVSPGGYVIACEPYPEHAEHLRHVARLNTTENLIVEEIALSSHAGPCELLTSLGIDDSIHTLVPEFAQRSRVARGRITVSAISLDDLLEKHAGIINDGKRSLVIKIDAEGSECDILEGASQMLRQPRLKGLLVEVTGGEGKLGQRARQCVQLLRGLGLTLTVLTAKSSKRLREARERSITEEDYQKQINLLARKP
jgi:FkbM family methyltransferase